MICLVPILLFLPCPTTVTCFRCIYCEPRRSFPLTCAENNIWNERRKGLWVYSEDGIHFHLALLCFGRFPIRHQSSSHLLACVFAAAAAAAIFLHRRFVARVLISYLGPNCGIRYCDILWYCNGYLRFGETFCVRPQSWYDLCQKLNLPLCSRHRKWTPKYD